MFRKKLIKESKVDTLIGAQVRVEGNLLLERGCTQIDGHFKGSISSKPESETSLIISPGAVVEGDVEASMIFVQGELKGNLRAYKKVTLMSQALINGDIYYQSIEMHLGAKVNGQFICQLEFLKESEAESAVPLLVNSDEEASKP